MRKDLAKFLMFYNVSRRHGGLQKELKVRTPFDAVECWYNLKPELFTIQLGVFKGNLLVRVE